MIAGLDNHDLGVQAYPFAKFFDRKYDRSGRCHGAGKSEENCKHESCFFVAMRFAFGVENVDMRYCTGEFLHMVNAWEGRCVGMDCTIEHVVERDLPDFVFDNESNLTIEEEDPLEFEYSDDNDNVTTMIDIDSKKGQNNEGLTMLPISVSREIMSPAKRART